MGLSTAGLSVGKAGRLGAFEGLSDEGQHRNLVDVLVAVFHVERVVERKLMLFDVLCQVHLQLDLLNDERLFRPDVHDVLCLAFLCIQRSFAHHYSDLGRFFDFA